MSKEYLKYITSVPNNYFASEFRLFADGSPLSQMQAYPSLKESIKTMLASIVSVSDTETFRSLADKLEAENKGLNDLITAVNDTIAPVGDNPELPAITSTIADKSNHPYRFFNGMKFYKYDGETLPPMEVEYPITDCNQMFASCYNLKEISAFEILGGADMYRMFFDCHALVEVPPLDSSELTEMENMFYGCYALKEIPYLDTSKVTNIKRAFNYCRAITAFPLIDISNITSLEAAWIDCRSLVSMPLLDTSNVTSFREAFYMCYALKEVPLFDTSNVTVMSYMFKDCKALESVPLFNTAKVTSMYDMFYGCIKLTTVPKFDMTNVTDTEWMFYNCSSLLELPELDLSNVKSINLMFYNCKQLTALPQSICNLVNCTSMSRAFDYCRSLQQLPKLITPKVETMYNTFRYCQKLTRIEEIDFASLTTWAGIFAWTTALTYMVVKNLGMSAATSYSFENATAWGAGDEENRQSVIDSLITYSYDRVAAGLDAINVSLWSTTYNLLTEEEIAAIAAKGFTLVCV